MSDWHDSIKRDLLPFANPGTKLECSECGRWFDVSWKTRRQVHTASFLLEEDGEIGVRFNGIETNYRSFLSSPLMSDMLGIAAMILQDQKNSIYVETKAKRPSDTVWGQSALKLINDSVSNARPETTTVVFITADAGAGKTELLKQLVRRQAERYLIGDAEFLYLYVNAQGRALARLEEALATEIQDLRAANLTYHVVPTLTRNKILVPLIDGFDELLGVLGYEDSFSSLRRFMNDLDGLGCIVASARSTYFQQEFLARANKSDYGIKDVSITEIDLLPWGNEEFQEYIEKRISCLNNSNRQLIEFKSSMTKAFSEDGNELLRSKPFFVSAAASLILDGVEIDGRDLIDQLIEGFVERERREKLLDKSGRPLLSNDQIRDFILAIAEEMWAGETRSLDIETVRTIADIVFRVDDHDIARILQERAAKMAFFTAGSDRGRVEFEHQLFFSYFLGQAITNAFQIGTSSIYTIFVRAALPEQSAQFAAKSLLSSGAQLTKILEECDVVSARGSHRVPQIMENAASVVAAFLKESLVSGNAETSKGLIFKNLIFAGEDFVRCLVEDALFQNVQFKRCDMTKLKILSSRAENVFLQEVTIDPSETLLEIFGLEASSDVYGLKVRVDDRVEHLFRQTKIVDALRLCRLPSAIPLATDSVDASALDLLERVLRKFEKSNVFWPADDENKQIVNNPAWGELIEILISNQIIRLEKTVAQRGHTKTYFRKLFTSDEIMAGEYNTHGTPNGILNLWKALRKIWPPK